MASTNDRIAAALERLADSWDEQTAESKRYRKDLRDFEHKAQKETAPSFMERQTIALETIADVLSKTQ